MEAFGVCSGSFDSHEVVLVDVLKSILFSCGVQPVSRIDQPFRHCEMGVEYCAGDWKVAFDAMFQKTSLGMLSKNKSRILEYQIRCGTFQFSTFCVPNFRGKMFHPQT